MGQWISIPALEVKFVRDFLYTDMNKEHIDVVLFADYHYNKYNRIIGDSALQTQDVVYVGILDYYMHKRFLETQRASRSDF